MERVVDDPAMTASSPSDDLLALYDDALPHVYGYLARRCGSVSLAEDLTSETFLAAVDAVRNRQQAGLSTAWLMRVARNKLVDHWRRREREERRLTALDSSPDDDRWEIQLDVLVAHETLARLRPQHRVALTLRYLDGLPVPEVAEQLDRTVGATEVLLVRARRAFRSAYEATASREEER
jgi:RNA polymerase sigma-70 factor (ECF subfamily)